MTLLVNNLDGYLFPLEMLDPHSPDFSTRHSMFLSAQVEQLNVASSSLAPPTEIGAV